MSRSSAALCEAFSITGIKALKSIRVVDLSGAGFLVSLQWPALELLKKFLRPPSQSRFVRGAF
jgi:hypothetical protein